MVINSVWFDYGKDISFEKNVYTLYRKIFFFGLGITKLKISDYLPLVSKCERRLGGVSSMFNQAGKLQITNAVLSYLPTYYMCSLELPKAVIKQIDNFRKKCLWRGSNINGGSFPKAAWEMVCNSKEEVQNKALLTKNLDMFYNKISLGLS
jgi:hypothetical protein